MPMMPHQVDQVRNATSFAELLFADDYELDLGEFYPQKCYEDFAGLR